MQWALTRAQMKQLDACQSLSELCAGQWSLDAAIGQPTYEQQLDDHLGQLVRSVLARPALAASAGRDTVPLQHLWLDTSTISPAVWRYVVQLTDLTDLDAWWSPELTHASWCQLSGFHQLETFALRFREPHPGPELFDTLLPLLPPAITLFFVEMYKPTAVQNAWHMGVKQLEMLVRSLPHLRMLHLCHVHIDINALAALSSAAELIDLTLEVCASTKFDAHVLRVALPPLSHLTALHIRDQNDARLTAAEAEPLTRWILARCPKLTRANFKQDLFD